METAVNGLLLRAQAIKSTQSEFTRNNRMQVALAGAKKYHEQGFYGQGITVAIIDSGVDPHHEFSKRLDYSISVNFNLECSVKNEMKDESLTGHGTAVASVVAGFNTGIAPMAKIASLKTFDGLGNCYVDSVIAALNHVADNPDLYDIVNMSLGCASGALTTKQAAVLEAAIKRCVAAGIPCICAAGNTGKEQYIWPASFEDPISVGAIDLDRKAAWFTTMNSEVDMCQVGVGVTVATLDGCYGQASGTSFAAPCVSGIAALIASKYKAKFGKRIPEMQLFETLMLNTVDVDLEGIDKKTGAGFCTLGIGRHIKLFPGSTLRIINGEGDNMDVATTIINDRTMTPAKYSVEPLGAEIFALTEGSINIIG